MRISKINAQPAFSGTVIMNRAEIARKIADTKHPEQAEALVNGINALRKNLEQQTPNDKIYTISYGKQSYKSGYNTKDGRFHIHGFEGKISVADENFKEFNGSIILSESKSRYGYWDEHIIATPEEIQELFECIEDKAIASSAEKYDADENNFSKNEKTIFDMLA